MSAADDTRKNFSPLQILGWLTGALSSLNLIEELSPVKIYGNLKKWLDAYTDFVEKIGNFVFGWIHFDWVEVSDLEMHALAITTVLITAYCRADFRLNISQGVDWFESFGMSLLIGMSCFWFILWPILLLPSRLGLFGAIIILLILIYSVYTTKTDNDALRTVPRRKAIFNELIGVAAIFLFLIALNYAVFKFWS